MEGGPGLDLAGEFRRDGLAQPRAGAAADETIQPGHVRIRVEALDVALVARHRRELGRGHDPRVALRRREQVAGPSLDVELRAESSRP